MAEHGTLEYATAEGNDYVEHEGTYERFLHAAFVGTICVINIILGIAISTLSGHWFIGAVVIFLVAPIGGAISLWSKTKTATFVALAIALLGFVFTAF
jgi:hypothetical protein